MSVVLHIAGIDMTMIRRDYSMVRVVLGNSGNEPVAPGYILAKQTLKDGTIRMVDFHSIVSLMPGDLTKVSQLLRGDMKEIEFKSYRTADGLNIPLMGTARRGFFKWSFAA